MRLLRALTVLLALLGVAVALAAWLVPPRLDLDRYRSEIAALASVRLGRPVSVGGRIALRLLPEPMLTASDISVGPPEAKAAGVGVTAAELRLRLALGPLLRGRIDARELVLRGADVRLPWPLDPATLTLRAPTWLSAVSASVEDGRLQIGGLAFTNIAASLTSGGPDGGYTASGTATFSGRPWRFTARLTETGADGAAGIDLTLDGQGRVQGLGGTLSGQIAADGTLAGRIAVRGPDLSQLLPAPAVSFKAEGRLSIAAGLAAADDLAAEIGGSPARGAVALRVAPVPRLDLALAASRLDLDLWLPVFARPSPPPIPVGIDLSAEAASLAGGTVRSLRAAVDLTEAGAELKDVSAVLPGEAPVHVAGHLGSGDGAQPRPRFEGDASVSAPALGATLAWLEHAGLAPLSHLPQGVLRSADLSGHVVAEPGRLAVAALDGMIDASHVGGSLTLRAGQRFAIGAGLTVDRIDLDAWLPDSAPTLPSIPARFARFDVDLRLEARQATLRGVTLAPLSLDAAAEGGRVTVRKLDAQVNGVHANGSVTVADGGRLSEGRLDLQAPQAEKLNALLPDQLSFLGHRAPRLWRAAANVQVLGAGMPDSLGLKITADLADLHLEAQPTLNLSKRSWTATTLLRHPGAPRLAEALGLASAASWLGDGSLSVVAQMSGAANRVAADSFELSAGSLRATGALTLALGSGRPMLGGQVAAETLPLPLVYPRAPDPLPLATLQGWDGSVKLSAAHVLVGLLPALEQATASLSLSHGVLRIDPLAARVAGGTLSGLGVFDMASSPPALRVNFSLTDAALAGPLFDLPLDLLAGHVDAGAAVSAFGHAPATLLATLAGDVRLAARDGTAIGFDLSRLDPALSERAVRSALSGGATPFRSVSLAGQLAHGVLSLTGGVFSAAAADGAVSGTVDLPEAAGDLLVQLRPRGTELPRDAPMLGLRLIGPLDALHRVPDLAAAARWHAQRESPLLMQ